MNSTVMKKSMYLFVLPALIVYLTFWIFPILRLFQYSFTDYNGVQQNLNFIGLNNYIKIFKEGIAGSSISNTLIYTLLSTVLGNIIALCLAFVLDSKIKGLGFYRTVAYI